MGLEKKYDAKSTARLWVETQRMVAVIVGTVTQLQTQPFNNLDGDEREVVAQRYKIRILGQDPPDKDESMLPVAYPLQISSGLGGQSMGTIKYTPNTYVYVSKDPNSGTYLIERVVPNYIRDLLKDNDKDSKGDRAYSGFLPINDSIVPDTYVFKGDLNSAELFGSRALSDEDVKHSFNTKLPAFTSACKKINTSGVNDAVDGLIRDVESLRTGIVGEDSFLATSQQFLSDTQNAINGASVGVDLFGNSFNISLANASSDIANIISSLIQQTRRFILRKVSAVINDLIGNVPISTRFLANEATDKALSAISCLFYRVLKGLEGMIGNILSSIINKVLNSAECLIENIMSGILGNVLGNLLGGINSILSSVGGIIGEAINLTNDVLDFVKNLLDLISCPVENECPEAEEWDFLNGSTAPKKELNFTNIFNQTKGFVESVSSTVGNVTATFDDLLDDFTFRKDDGTDFNPLGDVNVGNIFDSIINGRCDVGPVPCGPPTVEFFGGDGSGGTGNPIVNALGEVIGVDIITPGKYASPPLMEIKDSCGNGKGAIGIPVMGNPDVEDEDDIFDEDDDGDDGDGSPDGDDGDGSPDGDGRNIISPAGRVLAFELKETYTFATGNPPGFYPKKLGEPALSVFGGQADLWKSLNDTVTDNINLIGGSGTGLKVRARFDALAGKEGRPNNTSYAIFRIVDRGKGYKVGDILTFPDIKGYGIKEGSDDQEFLFKITKVSLPVFEEEEEEIPTAPIRGVLITNPGYGYEGFPYGDKGGSGRVWANRCQSTVLRANYDWDSPYSNGQTVTVFYGDTVTLPGQNPVVIDENFEENMIPGCIVNGVNPKIKDMQNFDYTFGRRYDYGIRHQFGLDVDAQRAFDQGFTEQDIRFYLENKFFLRVGEKMRQKLLDPNWGKIPEFSVTFTAPGCPPGTPEDPNQPPSDGIGNIGDGDGDGNGDGSPDGDYEVIPTIDDIIVINPGFGYGDDDSLVIGDGNGSGDLIIENGAITGVRITNPGIGFTTLPDISINTRTGYNAILKPVLKFIKPNESGFVVPFGTPTIQVIDCVGKV